MAQTFNYAPPAQSTGSTTFNYAPPSAAPATPQPIAINTPAAQPGAGSTIAPEISSAFQSGIAQANAGSKEASTAGSNLINRGEGVLNFGAGVAGAALSPLAPILNPLGKAINMAGTEVAKLPTIASYGKAVANLPQNGQPDTPTRILQAIQNASVIGGSLLGLDEGGETGPTKLPVADESTEGTPNIRRIQNLPVKGTSVETPVNMNEAYVAPDKLPTIQMGPKAPETLPTIQFEPPKTANSDIEPIKAPVSPKIAPTATTPPKLGTNTLDLTKTPEIGAQEVPAKDFTPSIRGGQNLKPIKGTGDTATRGVSKSIEASAIQKGLVDSFGELPEYQKVNFKDQASKVSDIITKDPDGAKDIALGNKPAPSGVIPEMIAVGVEKQALADNDVETLRQLANSKLTQTGTTMGQRIAAYGQRDAASPSAAIKEVQDAREAALKEQGRNKSSVVKKASETIKKLNTKETWDSFVKSLEC